MQKKLSGRKKLNNDQIDFALDIFKKYRDLTKNCLQIENDMNFHLWDERKKATIETYDVAIEIIEKIKKGDNEFFVKHQKLFNSISDIQDKITLKNKHPHDSGNDNV